MKKLLALLGAALGFALLFTGCDTDNSSSRVQEKSAVYATLKPWEKKYISNAVVSTGFTPDMVYMSIGNPSKKQTVDAPEGQTEVWTYTNYYPSVEAGKMRYNTTTETGALAYTGAGGATKSMASASTSSRNGGPSLGTTGGPQGGSMDIADMQSYTFTLIFKDGKVSKMALDPN
jgi:hypothetical protein